MPSETYPIVGAHFRPPAKAILQVLLGGCPLLIIPEPENPHDPNALRVEVTTTDISESQDELLEQLASGYGSSIAEIRAQDSWHLGYIPRVDAVNLVHRFGIEPLSGSLTFNAKGAPCVSVDFP